MSINREGQNLPRLSLESFNTEHYSEQENSDPESSRPRIASPLVAKHYFQFYHQAIADIRYSRNNLILWLLSTLFFAVVRIISNRWNSRWAHASEIYCTPNGLIGPSSPLDLWASSDFFQVNIAIGNFTFTQAKVIDTAWDLTTGRGGQAILTMITWKAFAKCVAMSMATQPVTFATYRILFVDSGPSISSTASLLYDFIKFRGLGSKWASAFLIYSMLLILAFPTLVSSATGYTTLNQAFFSINDNTLVPLPSLSTSATWDYYNKTYTFDDITQRGTCVPFKDRYQWGASFLQIFSLFTSVALWTTGCLALVLSSHAHRVAGDTRGKRDPRDPKGYQAMGILVEYISEQLTDSNMQMPTTSDQQLKIAIKAKLGGGAIAFGASGQRQTFRQWLAKERMWFICLCVSVMAGAFEFFLFMSVPTNERIGIFSLFFFTQLYMSLGIFFAIITGHSSGSRFFLILGWTAFGVGVGIADSFIPF